MRTIRGKPDELTAALYLQVSIISQALIFVTRSRSWSFVECPGLLLVGAFIAAQMVSICSIRFCFPYLSQLLLVHCNIFFTSRLMMVCCINLQYFSIEGGYSHCCVCKLVLCKNRRHWLGMGRNHLAF